MQNIPPSDYINPSEADSIARQILFSCGGPAVLVVGSDPLTIVSAFLQRCVDAKGVTNSHSVMDTAAQIIPDRIRLAFSSVWPFEPNSFDTVVVTQIFERNAEKIISVLQEAKRVTRRAIFLRFRIDAQAGVEPDFPVREWIEKHAFAIGLRKHPSYYFVNSYEGIKSSDHTIQIILEPIPAEALSEYPIQVLAEERDLHMDMLREAGARSDAHVCRYQWAIPYVRPGDAVLDAACGLGYGSYVIQTNTKARRTIGIDNSPYAVAYATKNFASMLPNLEFRRGDLPYALHDIPSNSIDVVTSFETLEHIAANDALLAEIHRVLTPAGRLLVSIPNDWTDETGNDPNPFHVHVYTLERLRGELARLFTLENLTAQSASRHKSSVGSSVWVAAGRRFEDVPVDIEVKSAPLAEWWLAVGMKSPLEGRTVAFRETQFPSFDDESWHVTKFGRDYENPWLVRGLVDITHRLKNPSALSALASEVIETSKSTSPDTGAALANIGYRLLETAPEIRFADVSAFAARAASYINGDINSAHGLRWKISLNFLCGKLWLANGRFDSAKECFAKCVSGDPFAFSPLLANRTVEARLLLGMLCVASGDPDSAANHWRRGIKQALEAVSFNISASIGDANAPAEFGLPELASVLEYASSCAYALNGLSDAKTRPLWWFEQYRDRLSQRRIEDVDSAALRQERNSHLQQLDALRIALAAQEASAIDHRGKKTNKRRKNFEYWKESFERKIRLVLRAKIDPHGNI